MTIQIFFPGLPAGKPTFEIEMLPEAQQHLYAVAEPLPEATILDIEPAQLINQQIVLSPAQFNEEGFVRVRLSIGALIIKAGALRIVQKPLLNSPVAQS